MMHLCLGITRPQNSLAHPDLTPIIQPMVLPADSRSNPGSAQTEQPWPVRHLPNGRAIGLGPAALIVPLLVLAAAPAFAQVANEYRQFLGIDTRKLIWFLAQAQKLDPGQGIKERALI